MDRLLAHSGTVRLLGLDLADASLPEVAEALALRSATLPFSYVVTPNADHYVRLGRQRDYLLPFYLAAGALLLDSRVVRRLARALGLRVPPVVTGSDLTAQLFKHWIAPDEPLTIIGTTLESVAHLVRTFSLTQVAHFAPPFGFESDPKLIDQCVQFVHSHPARFIFLACGTPRQELLAHRIEETGGASGIGLCIGAAIDQIGGIETRAPQWMRSAGFEWCWRISRDPKRLGLRYLQDLAIIPALIRERIGARVARADRQTL
jgi:N-acetylglucosaminyldiphosphoundecaprenol N-acetyl-beta-D-mannosaminyltransferase